MIKFYLKIFFLCIPFWCISQTYPDHFGTGQEVGVSVSSSNEGSGNVRNLALHQPASQSSDFDTDRFPPSNANDGINNTINHTVNSLHAWWQVDLGSISDITTIDVLNRTNCCSDRLNNFYVFVSNTPFSSDDPDITKDQSSVFSFFTGAALDVNTITVNQPGRFVRVQLAGTSALHMAEVKVFGTAETNAAVNTLNGSGTLLNLAESSRFLTQATMGYNYEEIERVKAMGVDAWLDEQYSLPFSSYNASFDSISTYIRTLATNASGRERSEWASFVFYDKITSEPDYLRHKAANALSQIIVVSSDDPNLEDRGHGITGYYDILYQGAFGNYRDILSKISIHTAVGTYLSSYRNSKADFGLGIFPDENYAREVMQLFSIGLLELNIDGSLKLDSNGKPIPTYDNNDIREMAKVFTGMGVGRRIGGAINFDLDLGNAGQIDFGVPMHMYEDYHDKQEKVMIDGSIIPAGQAGFDDIEDCVDVLFNHANVGPFIGLRLIQQLVKSNPSPAYISRVASVFNNNGQGVRGDMKAVFNAILTDPEARNCDYSADLETGKLLQPLERITKLFIGFDISSPSGRMWFDDRFLRNTAEQSFARAPSVFNYFSPFYAEAEFIEPNDLVSPEFQILNSTSSIHFLNIIEDMIKDQPFDNYTSTSRTRPTINNNDRPVLDFSDEINILVNEGLEAMIDRLDILLCRGQLTDDTRVIIENAIVQSQANVSGYDSTQAVQDAIYFIMVSPDFMILD